jgi:hypothetical protein
MDLIRCSRKYGGHGRLAMVPEPVRAIGRERVRMGQHVLWAADPLQARYQLRSVSTIWSISNHDRG